MGLGTTGGVRVTMGINGVEFVVPSLDPFAKKVLTAILRVRERAHHESRMHVYWWLAQTRLEALLGSREQAGLAALYEAQTAEMTSLMLEVRDEAVRLRLAMRDAIGLIEQGPAHEALTRAQVRLLEALAPGGADALTSREQAIVDALVEAGYPFDFSGIFDVDGGKGAPRWLLRPLAEATLAKERKRYPQVTETVEDYMDDIESEIHWQEEA